MFVVRFWLFLEIYDMIYIFWFIVMLYSKEVLLRNGFLNPTLHSGVKIHHHQWFFEELTAETSRSEEVLTHQQKKRITSNNGLQITFIPL